MRNVTERVESIELGMSELVGTYEDSIVAAVDKAFSQKIEHAGAQNPYGDGKAAERILSIIADVKGPGRGE